jgi:hypothetical protein
MRRRWYFLTYQLVGSDNQRLLFKPAISFYVLIGVRAMRTVHFQFLDSYRMVTRYKIRSTRRL